MQVPFLDLKAQYQALKPELDQAIADTLEEAQFVNGKAVTHFEQEFARFVGVKQVVGCANGTDALELLLRALEVGEGHEVLVPAISWISTSEVVISVGAKPVFIDLDPETYTLDPEKIEEKITDRTRAIIPVHLYGHPAAMPQIMAIAERHNLYVIEDCAQAHGAAINGKNIGTWGHAAAFSFFPSKNLGAFGDAGAIATDNEELARKVRILANHGQVQRHQHEYHGRNSRLDTLQAAILRVKLKHLPTWLAQRSALAERYTELLEGLPLKCPQQKPGYAHVYHLYVIHLERRDELQQYLADRQVPTSIHYPTALPFLSCYQYLNHQSQDFPVAYQAQSSILSLPFYPELPAEAQAYVADQIKQFYHA